MILSLKSSKRHKAPLRLVKEVLSFGQGLFDYDTVIFECGHKGRTPAGAFKGRCWQCQLAEGQK